MESVNNYSLTNSSFWKRLLTFDAFITGTVLKIIYLVGLILIVVSTIGGGLLYFWHFLVGLTSFSLGDMALALLLFVVNLIVGILAILILRIYCEFIMVIFKINENLQSIRNRNEQN